jgi:hypothetical protein
MLAVKMCGAAVLPAASVASRPKNIQIYIIKRAKKMCSGKSNSQDLVLGEEHTTWRRKFKNFK